MSAALGAPRISVVVPAFNVAPFVGATLRSVQEQTVTDWECIVIDDGSEDDTADVVAAVAQEDSRVRLVRQTNHGLSAARNAGLRRLTPSSRYVAFLDSDDVWCPTALADLGAALDAHPDAVGAWGYAEQIDAAGDPVRPALHPSLQRDRRRIDGWRLRSVEPGEPLRFDEVVVAGPVWPPAVALHRRDAVEGVGTFDESLRQLEDWDFYTRMARRGPYQPVERQVAWYRQHEGQMTRRVVEFVCNLDAVRRKTWASPDNTPAQRRAATRAWRQLQVRRAGRSAQRLVRAVRDRSWADVPPLVAGTAVLAAQNLGAGPPRTTAVQVRWSRRTL